MISDEKLEDIKVHKELVDLLDTLKRAYPTDTEEVGKLLVDTHHLAKEYERRIGTHSYALERIPLSSIV